MKNERRWQICAVVLATVVILLLFGVGVPSLVAGISLINDAQGMDNGGDAFACFMFGILAAILGCLLSIAAAVLSFLGLGAWFVSQLLKPPKTRK
jgi:protein-S-isoprenylcysteine O-methyltransferase Ste14